MNELVQLLKEKGLSLGAVESFTGGLFAHEVTNVSGASEVFRGSLVTYQLCTKEHILGIESQELLRYGAVSKEIALQMAKNGALRLASDITLAFTGNAGPTASEGKEVGLVYLALSYKKLVQVDSFHLKGTRESIKQQAVDLAKKMVIDLIKKETPFENHI